MAILVCNPLHSMTCFHRPFTEGGMSMGVLSTLFADGFALRNLQGTGEGSPGPWTSAANLTNPHTHIRGGGVWGGGVDAGPW